MFLWYGSFFRNWGYRQTSVRIWMKCFSLIKFNIINFFSLWPKYVKDRIKTTYLYFGGSIAVTAASAAAAFRSPIIMNLVARNGWMVRNRYTFYTVFTYYNIKYV